MPLGSEFSRRRALVFGLAALALGKPALAAPRLPVVTVLGDSITAGLGLAPDQAMPARLQEALNRMGVRALVRAAGVSGDTSGAGLARVDRSVGPDTTLCVVALGGNDLLQGYEPAVTKANLRGIIERLRARRIGVVLAGIKAPSLLGPYARAFSGLYGDLAREMAAPLMPNLIGGVIGVRRMMQSDGIHPNAEGAKAIAEALAPVVAAALNARR